jgi:hypothetical protein
MTQNPIITRMLEATGAYNASHLASKLGIRPQSLQQYKSSDSVPKAWLKKLQASENINPEYLQTGQGPVKLGATFVDRNLDASGRRFETMVFHPNGKDRVQTDNPAAGIVTNASGLDLPIGHMIEHILCPEVRPCLSGEGDMELTGSGLALPAHHLDRLGANHAGARTLQTAEGLVVFDITQTDAQFGASYVIAYRGFLVCMRLEMGAIGPGFTPLSGQHGPSIPLTIDQETPAPRIIGKAVWIGKGL